MAGDLDFLRALTRPFLTSWLMVGTDIPRYPFGQCGILQLFEASVNLREVGHCSGWGKAGIPGVRRETGSVDGREIVDKLGLFLIRWFDSSSLATGELIMLEITDVAAEKIREVLVEEGKEDAPLRVIALPNGQGGVQYMLTLEEDNQPDDRELDRSGIRFLVDSDSAPFLEKATIDFVEDFTRVGFLITNPDFPAAGGCGSGGCGCGAGGGGGCGGGGGGCGCGGGGCGGH